MMTNNIFVFLIILHPANLQYLLVIYLIRVKLNFANNIQLIFGYRITTINLITITKFFQIICNTLFKLLFIADPQRNRLLEPILNYF